VPELRERLHGGPGQIASILRGVVVVDDRGIVQHADDEAAALLRPGRPFARGDRLDLDLTPGVRTVEVHLDDEPRVVVLSVSEVPLGGGRTSTIVTVADATAALDEVNRLIEATAVLEAALGAASHEIRSPVAVILVGAETLRLRWDDLSDEDRLDTVRRIERQAHFLRRVGDRILGGTGHGQLALMARPEVVDVSTHLFTKLADLDATPQTVRVACPPGTRVYADPDQLWEVMANFLENGLKYAGPPVDIDVVPRATVVEFRVCDQGPGVEPEFVDHLFRPFSRAPDAPTRASGTGLGLSLARELARANGGDAWYEPNRPSGACFCFSVPRAP